VTTSLAGRVANPRLPRGEVRIGGFGGPATWPSGWRAMVSGRWSMRRTRSPERISASAAQACPAAGVPLLRLERPGWRERPGDRWHRVRDLPAAAVLIPRLGARRPPDHRAPGARRVRRRPTRGSSIRCVDPPRPPLPPATSCCSTAAPTRSRGERELIDRARRSTSS
jgi:precorrin-6A/cobalt-precorrin-6A reductase